MAQNDAEKLAHSIDFNLNLRKLIKNKSVYRIKIAKHAIIQRIAI